MRSLVGAREKKVSGGVLVCHGIRVYRLLERNGIRKDFAITGGIAKNIGVTRRIELGCSASAR